MSELLFTGKQGDSRKRGNGLKKLRDSGPLSPAGRAGGDEGNRNQWIVSCLQGTVSRLRTRRFQRSALWVAGLLLSGSSLRAQEAAASKPVAEPEAPPPIFGMETTGSLDLGYRWNAGLRGSHDLYRSLVNLGEGPRLLGANLTMASPLGAGKYVDRIQLNASAWGGDPYNTVRLFAEKSGIYQFSFDYRKVDYFNFIPYIRESTAQPRHLSWGNIPSIPRAERWISI